MKKSRSETEEVEGEYCINIYSLKTTINYAIQRF